MFISGAPARPTEKAGPPSARRKLTTTPELTQSPSGKPSSGAGVSSGAASGPGATGAPSGAPAGASASP